MGSQLLTQPCASPPQLTVYLGKRDFVDHVDLVDPVGESLEAIEEGSGGGGPGQAPSREVCVHAAQAALRPLVPGMGREKLPASVGKQLLSTYFPLS